MNIDSYGIDMSFYIIAGLGVVSILAIAWLRSITLRRRAELTLSLSKSEYVSENVRNLDLAQRNEKLESELVILRDRFQDLNIEYVELKTTLKERERQHQQQLSLFDQQKKALEKEFELLANRIFDEKGARFTQANQLSLDGLLKPFREQISEFRSRVDGIHKENNESTGSLKKELEHLRVLNQRMTDDAQNLTDALKGDKKKLGGWGEVQLEKTLELAGLLKGEHFDAQAYFKNAKGKTNFPDFVINLPDGKHLVIDSKVSLVAYDTAVSANTVEERNVALRAHVKAIRHHINDLAEKDYSQLAGMDSPNFVLMFLPIEPAYIEAVKHSPEIYDEAYRKGVVLVTHSTMMPILRTVSNLWVLDKSHSESRELSEKAGDIYNQVCVIAERLNKLGNTMVTANKHYNSVVVALTGQQGLYGKVERFSQLSIEATKTMPDLSPLHSDIENERLSLIDEP